MAPLSVRRTAHRNDRRSRLLRFRTLTRRSLRSLPASDARPALFRTPIRSTRARALACHHCGQRRYLAGFRYPHHKCLLRRLDLERTEMMTWQFSKQLCFTVALVSVLISASPAPLLPSSSRRRCFGLTIHGSLGRYTKRSFTAFAMALPRLWT
jgi:hypothetical protein